MSTRPGTRSALLVIDVQVGVVARAWARDQIVARIAQAVAQARQQGVDVCWVQHGDDDLPPGSAAWAWVPELQPLPSEAQFQKRFNSAFEDTNLLAELDRRDVSHLVLAGAATNWCIRATAYGALDRGFDVTLLSDAHTTEDMDYAPGKVLRAEALIDELNLALRYLSYPGRVNRVLSSAELDFSTPVAT
jgi:nicotinamidase-related amidase